MKMATINSLIDEIPSEFYVYEESNLPLKCFPTFTNIRRQGKLCDVTLKVGEARFSAHKIILAASIPYFHAMFTHEMIETKQTEIVMQGLEAGALEALVNFAYTGRVEIDHNNAQSILIGSNFLQISSVRDACLDFMTKKLSSVNALSVQNFADAYMFTGLHDSASKFIRRYFADVSASVEFLQLPKVELVSLLSDDRLNVHNEEEVFEAAIGWVYHDIAERSVFLHEILSVVRLPLIKPQFLSDRVSTEDLVRRSHACRDLVDEAKDYYLVPERRLLLQTQRTRPRCCTDIAGKIYAVGGLSAAGHSQNTVEVLDTNTTKWMSIKPMNSSRSRVGITTFNDRLYALGGYDGTNRLNTVEVYTQSLNDWHTVVPMNFRRSALGAVSLANAIYCCGGYDGNQSLSSVEKFTPGQSIRWEFDKSMLKCRSAAGFAVLDGQIFACGGHDGMSIFKSVEAYNPNTVSWTLVSPMLTKRCRLGMAVLHEKLYACGGYDGSHFLNSVEVYDPHINQWSAVAPMQSPRSRVALVTSCGRLYAIGGYDGATNLNTVEMYDAVSDQWTNAAPMGLHEGGVGAAVLFP